jgi:hypothetical protein
MTFRLALLLACAAAAPLAQAETYKWVDEKGVTNYSNTPPPAGKARSAVQAVEERISVYPSEPIVSPNAAPAVYQRLQAIEAEWLQRQRLMATAAAYPPATPSGCPSPYRGDCVYDGLYPYVPVVAVRRPVFVRPAPVRTRRIALERSR